MDDRLKHLVEELGVAINDSLSASEEIPGVIARIEGSGYHVLLFFNATIAVIKKQEATVGSSARMSGKAEAGFNSEDVEFLKSMHIRVNR